MAMILIWKNTDIDFGYTEVRRNTKNKNEGDSNMKFVLDTNIYLHYKLFTERDWKTLLGSEYLTLVVLPTVIKELDEKKEISDSLDKTMSDALKAYHEEFKDTIK